MQIPQDRETQTQVLAIMLLHGTEAQRGEAIEFMAAAPKYPPWLIDIRKAELERYRSGR